MGAWPCQRNDKDTKHMTKILNITLFTGPPIIYFHEEEEVLDFLP